MTQTPASIHSTPDLDRLEHLEAAWRHHTARGHSLTAHRLRREADHLRRRLRDAMSAAGQRPSVESPCPVCGWTGDAAGIRCRFCRMEGN